MPQSRAQDTPPTPPIAAWIGPPRWRGDALPAARDFDFAALPWNELDRPGRRAGGVECVKATPSRRVLRGPWGAKFGGPPGSWVYAKRYLVNTLRRKIGNRIVGCKAEREFQLGHAALKAGLASPLPLAWARRRSRHRLAGGGELPAASYLLTLEWPNQGSIRAVLAERPERRDELAASLARFLAAAHQAGFYHDDCTAEHVLVGPGAAMDSLAFIDLDNGQLAAAPISWRRRAANLFQILRSIPFKIFPSASRRKFVEAYLKAAGLAGEIPLEEAMETIEARARRKIGRGVIGAG